MKIYFGQLTGEYLEDSLAEGRKLFTCGSKVYDFQIEVFEDMFRISDTEGRILPLDLQDINSLIEAINHVKTAASVSRMYTEVFSDDTLVCVNKSPT